MLALRVFCVLACLSGALADRRHPEPRAPAAARAAPAAERTAAYWVAEAQAGVEQRAKLSRGAGKARNVVMFLGDGMSVPTLAAARALLGQREGKTGEEAQLSFEEFPTVGLSKTYCVNAQVADSACSATAYLCGVKTNNGMLGISAAVSRRDCPASVDPANHLDSIAAWALEDGRDVGIVTTTRITHASPAGTYAKTANRGWEDDAEVRADGHDPAACPDIAHQLVHSYPGNQFKVILGGGRRHFLPNDTRDEEGTRGRRTDNRNLIQEWLEDKRTRSASYAYAWNRTEIMELKDDPPEYLLGLFEGSHMRYHLEADPVMEPTLEELTEIAINSLSRNEKGFFLFVEGGRIDHGHHDNFVHLALDETIEMSKAVAKAKELLPEEESLIVVTADHAHVMAYSGYSDRGNDILGPNREVDDHGVPYQTLSYANGPGARPTAADGERVDVTNDTDYGELRWRSHADVPLDSETHGGDDVAVFAWGAHHDMFTGLYEQSRIPHLMAYAGCFGHGKQACGNGAAALLNTSLFTLLAAALVAINGRF